MDKDLKYLRTHYKRMVHPQKRMEWNPKKKRLIRIPAHRWPTLGHACPVCREFSNYKSHYLVHGVVMCESCALDVLRFDEVIPDDMISYHTIPQKKPGLILAMKVWIALWVIRPFKFLFSGWKGWI